MNDRVHILKSLQAGGKTYAHPESWQSRHRFDDLPSRFARALTDSGGEVHRAGALEESLRLLSDILHRLAVQRVVVNATPPLESVNLQARWPDLQWHVAGKSTGDLRSFCAHADAGISGAEAALAESGSLVLASGPGRSRLATLMPPVHIVLLPTNLLSTDLFTWTATLRRPMPAGLTVISGPSKTADIEQVLAVGVHGPKRLIVIVHER